MASLTQGNIPEDPDEVRFRQLQDALIAKGLVAPDSAPPTHQPIARERSMLPNPDTGIMTPVRREVLPPGPMPTPASSSSPTPRKQGRNPKAEVLRDLKQEFLKGAPEKVAKIAALQQQKEKEVASHVSLLDTPEGRAKLAAMTPAEQQKALRKARMAAQDAMAIARARERNEKLAEVHGKKYEEVAKTLDVKQGSHELAKSQRDLVEDNLLKQGYDKSFARKHSKTIDANCPACAYRGIKSPLSRDFSSTKYGCSNPDCGELFVPVDPTKKDIDWKSVRRPHEGSKSEAFKGQWKSSEELKPRILRKD